MVKKIKLILSLLVLANFFAAGISHGIAAAVPLPNTNDKPPGSEQSSRDTSRFKVELTYPDNDRSQQSLNMAAARELSRAEHTLNDIYHRVLSKHKDDPEFIDKFTKAQTAWLAFRDAELNAVFPQQDKRRYGSVFPMSYSIVKAELTWDRVKQLNQWLEGFSEGNVCAGSRWP